MKDIYPEGVCSFCGSEREIGRQKYLCGTFVIQSNPCKIITKLKEKNFDLEMQVLEWRRRDNERREEEVRDREI